MYKGIKKAKLIEINLNNKYNKLIEDYNVMVKVCNKFKKTIKERKVKIKELKKTL